MEIKAQLKFLHISPRKARLVAHLIKKMKVTRAISELNIIAKRSARPLQKLLLSALANARHNFKQEHHEFIIKSIMVNPGPVLKRHMPRAFGRASVIRKRTSHIQLILEDAPELKKQK